MISRSKVYLLILLALSITIFTQIQAEDIIQEDLDQQQQPKQPHNDKSPQFSQQQLQEMIRKQQQDTQDMPPTLPDYFIDTPSHLLSPPQDVQVAYTHLKTKDFLQIILFYKNIQKVHENMDKAGIKDILKERQGYFRFYALNCDGWDGKILSDDQDQKIFCKGKMAETLPYFWIVKPPLYDINPYTKKPMEAKMINYSEQERDKSKIQSFILKNLPDFTVKPSNQESLMKILDDNEQMNTLILLTEKDKTSAFVKALSAEFKDRLQIAVLNTRKQQPVIASNHNIIDYPRFMMAQNTSEGRKYHVYEGKMDLKNLKEYSNNFALKEKLVKKDDKKESEKKPKQPKKSYTEIDSSNFLSQMTGTHKGVLVYFHKPETDLKAFNTQIATKIDGPLHVLTVQCKQQNESIKKRLYVQKCPSFQFLKPVLTGKDKLLKVRELINTSSPKDILQQIKAIYKPNAISIDPQNVSTYLTPILKSYQQFVMQQDEQQTKPLEMTVLYYHQDDSDLRLAFKAVTTDPIFQGRIKFVTVGGARQYADILKIKKLPAVIAFMPNMSYNKKQKSNKEGENNPYISFQYPKKIKYAELHQFFSQFVQDVIEKQKAQEERISTEVVELKNQEDLERYCLSKGMVCGIGILQEEMPGQFQSQISVIREANKEIKGSNKYVYMYINAGCHKQLLKIFNLDASFLPTFVFYLPKHKKYSQMIGKFETASITDQLNKLVQGSVTNLYEMHTEFELKDQNCQEQNIVEQIKTQEQIDMEKEILEEILAEQRQKKLDLQKEYEESQKKKKKPKKNKKKKSQKKDAAQKQTDL